MPASRRTSRLVEQLRRGPFRLLPWAALGALLLAPCHVAYRAYRIERAGFITGPRGAAPDPATLGVEGLSVVWFQSSNGPKLHGVYAPPKNGACVVLAHGSSGDLTAVLPEAQILTKAGFGVLAFDFPGHGQSDGKIQWGEGERAALVSALDWLSARSEVDANRLGALGFSMGGYTVAQVGAKDRRLRAVALASSPGDPTEHTRWEYRQWGPLTQWPALLALRVSGMKLDELVPVDVVAKIAPRSLLVIAGAEDQHVPLTMTQKLYDAARTPKQLLIVKGAGHGGYRDASPQEYPRKLSEFFSRALL